jgi:hypothetical protein
MAASIIFGVPRLSRGRNNLDDGLLFEVGAVVKGLELGADTAVATLRKATAIAGFPALNSLYSAIDPTATVAPWSEAFLWDISLVGMNEADDALDVKLTYLAPADFGAGPPAWVVEDVGSNSIVQTWATADGSKNVKVGYVAGAAINVVPPAPYHVAPVTKIVGDRAVRVTARMSRSMWNAIKGSIRAASCKICSDNWGGYDKGTWIFLYPSSVRDSNGNLTVSLNFAYKPEGWYQFLAYIDQSTGLHPHLAATEGDVRTAGPPVEGDMVEYNGMSMISVQREENFGSTFAFTPD